ncbi:TPA: class I SAM-dependent methyltransferase [Staphylococcus aureus]|nr:class I SAM-dependent methyltransferase [Staphylococcus aureus]
MNNLFRYIQKPEVFEEGANNIWNEEKFSDYVLNSHLNSDIYGGSKDKKFIEKATSYIYEKYPPQFYKNFLDIGCGPGLYAEKLKEKGYNVTALDFSVNSIKYAKENSDGKVKYILGDLRNLNTENTFDISMIIYQTYATLPYNDRVNFLKKIHQMTESEGILILDVPSKHMYNQYQDLKVWEYIEPNNTFIKDGFFLIYMIQKYREDILLKKSIYTLESGEIIEFNDWMEHFNLVKIQNELSDYFEVIEVLSELDGSKYTNNSDTITLICKKK